MKRYTNVFERAKFEYNDEYVRKPTYQIINNSGLVCNKERRQENSRYNY
ncbi:MAG: hypothetical protein ACI9RG_000279 [Sulfurimonas sp.]|jgi:hypothetical protein